MNAELINQMHCMCSVKIRPSPAADLQFTVVFGLVGSPGLHSGYLGELKQMKNDTLEYTPWL